MSEEALLKTYIPEAKIFKSLYFMKLETTAIISLGAILLKKEFLAL